MLLNERLDNAFSDPDFSSGKKKEQPLKAALII